FRDTASSSRKARAVPRLSSRAAGYHRRVLPSGASGPIDALPRRWRAPGPALQGLLALVIYLAAFAWYAVPLIRYLGLPVIGHTSPDSNFYTWSLRWLPSAVSHGLNPLYSSQI